MSKTQNNLLPTPSTMDHLPPREGEARERQLRRGDLGGSRRTRSGNLREDILELLPTPKSSDGDFGLPRTSGRPPEDSTHLATRLHFRDFGEYTPAIERWEHVIGREAPSPLEPNSKGTPRLSPRFVEWMMGLPEGWVTGLELSRNDQLRMLGNGVVPQQAAHALRTLLDIT